MASSERMIQLTHKKSLFYQEGTRHQRGCGGSILGDTQNLNGQYPEQAALCDPTLSRGLDLATSRGAFPRQLLCHPVLGTVSLGQGELSPLCRHRLSWPRESPVGHGD